MKEVEKKDMPEVGGGSVQPTEGPCFPPLPEYPGPDYPQYPNGPAPEPLCAG